MLKLEIYMIKKWVFVAVFLFGIGLVLGWVAPTVISDLISGNITAFEERIASILTLPKFLVAMLIFINNVSAVLFSFVLSPLLCFAPVVALVANGCLLSFVSVAVVQDESLGFLLAGLLPHGVIELPALILGEAAALNFGVIAIMSLFSKGGKNLLLTGLRQNVRYLLFAIVLFLPAAIIEVYITPLLLTWYG